MAVGDGANDVSMIVEASVGIGLYGNEGLQAVQVSDYGIPSFKYLHRLIFFEGRRNYLRIARFFQVYIYKSILFAMVQVYFGFYCAWSGMTAFDGWYLYFYNLVFSVFAITWLGIFDEDIRCIEIESNSKFNRKLKA